MWYLKDLYSSELQHILYLIPALAVNHSSAYNAQGQESYQTTEGFY